MTKHSAAVPCDCDADTMNRPPQRARSSPAAVDAGSTAAAPEGRGDRMDSPAARHRPAAAPPDRAPSPRPAVPHRPQGPSRKAVLFRSRTSRLDGSSSTPTHWSPGPRSHSWPGKSPGEPPAGAGSRPRPSWIRRVTHSSTPAGACARCSAAGRTDSGPGSSPAPNRPQRSVPSVRPDRCPSEIDGHGEQLLSQHAGTRVRRVQKSEL